MFKCKKLARSISIAAILLSQLSTTLAADITLGAWHADGSQLWRTSFPLNQTGGINPGSNNGASQLYYPQSGNYLTAVYENQISPIKKFQIEAGLMGNIHHANGSDSDWDYSQSQNLWYYGEFNTGGHSSYVNIDWKEKTGANTEFFYGYTYRNNYFRMTDGLYSIEAYGATADSLPALDSTYRMVYQGPHVGITAHSPLTAKLSLVGSLSYSPLILAQGNGWWNLRDLSFAHSGSAQMLDTSIGLRYAVVPNKATITLGYRYQWFSLFRGWESISPDISWEKATNIQRGFYIAGTTKI